MSEQSDNTISRAGSQMKDSLKHLERELVKIHAGKANTNIVDDIEVEYYGNNTPLNQVANVSLQDSRTLTIQPWEKSMIEPIGKAILSANIGLTPQSDGDVIRLFMPPLTEERRKELVKEVGNEGESGKISIRNARRDAMEDIKRQQKDGLSEDEAKNAEVRIQGLTDKNIDHIDKILEDKERDIMTV